VYWQNGVRKEKTVDTTALAETLEKLAEAQKKNLITEFYYW